MCSYLVENTGTTGNGAVNLRGVHTKQLGLKAMTWELCDEDVNMS